MKLLDMTTEQSAEVLCTIAPLAENIISDKKLEKIIQKEIKKDDITRIEAAFEVMNRICSSIPTLLDTHKSDVFGIIAAVNQKSIEEIASQPLRDTITQIKEVFSDEELKVFFTSLVPTGANE